MTDKTPLASDHGASLFNHVEARRKFAVPGEVPAARPAPPNAAPGETLLSPHYAPPRREVVGKYVHDNERPPEERRAKHHGPGALSARLQGELREADRANGKHHSGSVERATGPQQQREK